MKAVFPIRASSEPSHARDMNPVRWEAEGLLARDFCHEIDHLDGHMYMEKVEGEIHDVHEMEESEETEEADEE